MRPLLNLIPPGASLFTLALIAAILVALYNTRARTFVTTLVLTPFAGLLWLFGVVAFILWWPASRLARPVFGRLARTLAGRLEAVAGWGSNPLRSGNREAAARHFWAEERFPFLYRPVPPDLLRPLYEDGRLIGGVGLAWLADRHMTRMALVSAIVAGFTAGLILLLPPVIELLNVVNISGSSIYHALVVRI